jgi:hypothetical protein
MNIKKVRKPILPSEKTEVTKLAIGIPGGIDAETDKYDTKSSVFCLACN